MNLHILTDSSISATFYRNLEALGLLQKNRMIVRSNKAQLRFISENLPFSPLYSKAFDLMAGDMAQYDKVFIHQFSPLMYRWVAKRKFKELNWLVWGADIYNLPGIDFDFYEDLTRQKFISNVFSLENFLFRLKIRLTNSRYKEKAYQSFHNVLTWMNSEYEFIRHHIPAIRAKHRFFFYENDLPYGKLDALVKGHSQDVREVQRLIIGNSGTPSNNHLDLIRRLQDQRVIADLVIPVSYGDKKYIDFLKKNLPGYTGGKIEFVDKFMAFEEYVNFLMNSDGLIMNNIRPQGYGNILMMLYLGKRVFLNEKNISLSDLERFGINVSSWSEINSGSRNVPTLNKEAISNLFSHDKLEKLYGDLFT